MQCQQKTWFSSPSYSPSAMDPETEQHHLNFELPKCELNKPLYFLNLCWIFHCSNEKKTEQVDDCQLAPAPSVQREESISNIMYLTSKRAALSPIPTEPAGRSCRTRVIIENHSHLITSTALNKDSKNTKDCL